MSTEKTIGFLSYNSADIYFIYSFSFDFKESYEQIYNILHKDLKWQINLPDDRKGRPPFLNIQRKNNSGKYISTSLCHELIKEQKVILEYSEKESNEESYSFDVKLNGWIRLFDNGAGTITFRVSLDDNVDFRKIQSILSLSQRRYNKLDESGNSQFISILKLTTSKKKKGEELYNLFVRYIRKIRDEINGPNKVNRVLLQDEEIMDLDDKTLVAQNPYVLSVIALKGLNDNFPCFQEPAAQNMKYKELATILFRLVYENSFYDDLKNQISCTLIPDCFLNKAGQLNNYAWDTRLLMSFSQSSSLFACLNKDELPATIVRYSLLDVLEILRTRWHMSILINAQLDNDLEDIKLISSQENLDVLLRLIERRKRFASFLHDPLTYALEGGSVSKFINKASEEMQLSLLREMTIEKFSALDRLHEDQSKYLRLHNLDNYLKKDS